jgi:hypothetical protein
MSYRVARVTGAYAHGANTVNGPAPERVPTRPVLVTAATSRVKRPSATAILTMVFDDDAGGVGGVGDGRGAHHVPQFQMGWDKAPVASRADEVSRSFIVSKM